jgi:branched-subunit amino acid aminotransferase/4-amino-4-deoxychorismate lyase
MEEIVFLNGSLVPRSRALISVFDHAFLYGFGLYESMRTYGGKFFLLDRHIMRLMTAAESIGLAQKLADIDFTEACRQTVAINDCPDARVRITVSNGASDAAPWTNVTDIKPNVVVTARPFMPFPADKYNVGFHVGISSRVRRYRQSDIATMKTVNHLESVLARMEAATRDMDEAILLNDEGYIAEGGGCNVFFVRESRLVTPSLNSGILPGVTREVVLELAAGLGIETSQGPVGIGVIRKCDEAFVTNAIIEIMPVTEVNDDKGGVAVIGGGKPGEITARLINAYKEKVEKEAK